ncbi:P-loop containing nucleoside triphosphate hydrolase protein [Lasiodiplodia theobromae]|uniref:P-loop containing nucleoside triphosphate hydrolase protein n=1 Tax=Lasiodiplodia theobromae TaxID=45133 RepID=UPI0015C336C4|nr:P-loop containing nucleoside triphosphate hydrolase protein [Lasiodiplodia theobromae]KAF4540673.1 P-loop containing nucleoside triphosphate hydrolase protein [Lasiodiplodia theobromae]
MATPENNDAHRPPMVMSVGLSGSGKSYFINKLAVREQQPAKEAVQQQPDSCTPASPPSTPPPTQVGKTKVKLLDTPSFEDTYRNKNADIINKIPTSRLRKRKSVWDLRASSTYIPLPTIAEILSENGSDLQHDLWREFTQERS